MAKRRSTLLAVTALGAALLVVVLVSSGGDAYPHRVRVSVANAFEAIPGERVVEGGATVGKIVAADVGQDGKAHLELGIGDRAWPLPADSRLTLRMSGTIKFTDRYIQITRGTSATTLADGAAVPSRQFTGPVEYDSLFDVFDKKTRAGLRSALHNAAPAFKAARPSFPSALRSASPVLDQADAVFRDLTHDQQALNTLVTSTGALTTAVATSNPGVRQLLAGGADTFSAFADQSASLQRTITAAAPAFRTTARALDRTSRSLQTVADLSDRLDPGVRALGRLAAPLDQTLQQVVDVTPTAVATFATVRRAGPSLDGLLSRTRTNLMPRVQSIGKEGAKQLGCIRPWTPELMSFMQGWGGFFARGLEKPKIHILHGLVSVLPFPNTMPITSKQVTDLFPGLSTSFPQVPGEDFKQPFFAPECGYTAKNLDPAKDTESHTYDPNGSKLVPYK